jgi:serine/threonine protein kinase
MPHDTAEFSEIEPIAALLPAFDFQGLIARGAAGVVYKARQRSLDRDVAIRLLPREMAADPASRGAFDAMAKAMAGLAHPGLIRVFDSGEVGGLPFMVMEYVPGKSLRHSARGSAIDPRQAVQIVVAACHGLAHAHARGIAHGAIHSANILLTPKCEPKIANFGFTRRDGGDASGYLAPELAAGSGPPNPQSDVYALGVLLRELLTGSPAGSGNQAPLMQVDLKLAAICQQATDSDPARRFPDAGALATALERWMPSRARLLAAPPQARSSPHRPKTPQVPAVARPGSRGSRVMLVHGAIIAVLLFAIHGVWGAYQEQQQSLARLRQMEKEKPREILIRAHQDTPPGIDPSIVQLKP